MDFMFEKQWKDTVAKISENFEEKMDLQTILFLIGLQELNRDYQKLNKDQKIEVMHIGLCTIFEPYGYYSKLGIDKDGWPHFKNEMKFPDISEDDQEKIIKEAIIDYFK